MFQAYHEDNDGVEFKFIHVFKRVETCEKWALVRESIGKGKDTGFDPIMSLPRPAMGNKKVKLARDEALEAKRLQSSIKKCIASVATNNAVTEEKYDAWWAMMFEKQEVKIDLLKNNVAMIKRKRTWSS
jgi:hypothetical protein